MELLEQQLSAPEAKVTLPVTAAKEPFSKDAAAGFGIGPVTVNTQTK